MIERFNFYDVFGFFIPGSLLLLVFWLPFGILSQSLPPSDLSSALVSVIVSYLAGHFMQAWANRSFPLAVAGRYPSSEMLDLGDRRFASKRGAMVRMFKSEFNIDVEAAADNDVERARADDRRDVAFLLARQRLIARGRVGYAEQFEGLYTMMRGIMVAAAIGAVYLFGWVVGGFLSIRFLSVVLTILLVIALVVMDLRLRDEGLLTPERREQEQLRARVVTACIFAVAALIGAILGRIRVPSESNQVVFVLSMCGVAALAIQAKASYRYYSAEFAKAVYRGFLELGTDKGNDDFRSPME